MKRRLNVSPTQVETHAHVCPRKRYIKNVLKVREPQSSSGMVGDACHEVIYDWLIDHKEPRGDHVVTYAGKDGQQQKRYPGQIVMNARHLLPAPGTVIAEGGVEVNTPAATWWLKIDWVRLSQFGLLLGDNKTTASPIYAMDSGELLQDIQNNVYSNAIFTSPKLQARLGLLRPPESIPVRWVYMLTDEEPRKPRGAWATEEQKRKWASWEAAGKPLAWAVEGVMYPHHVASKIAKLDGIVEEMAAMADAAQGDAMKVPGNPDGCSQFGGCKFQGTAHCQLSVADIYDRVYALSADVAPSTPPLHSFEQGDQPVNMPATIPPQMQAALANAAAAQAALAAQQPGAVLPPPPALVPPAPVASEPPASTILATAPYWQPGDPLTGFQPQFLGKPLMLVASAAPEAPAQAVILSWPGVMEPYSYDPAKGIHGGDHPAVQARIAAMMAAARTPATPPPPASFPPAPQVGTPVGVPEHGRINAPEGSTVAAKNPEQLQSQYEAHQATLPPPPAAVTAPPPAPGATDDGAHDTPPELVGQHRDALKKACIEQGALDPNTGKPIDKSSRLGIESLKAALANVSTARLRANAAAASTLPPPPAAAPAQPPPAAYYDPATGAIAPVATMTPSADLRALADAFDTIAAYARKTAAAWEAGRLV